MSGEEHYEQFDPYDDPYGEEEVVALEEVEGSSVPEPIPVGVEANPRYFNQIESDVLLERYVENYDIFHHAMSGATRQGLQAKKKFIMDLTEEINALGYVRRTEKQIEQRIRDEIKVLKKYGNAVRSEMSRTGGGRVVVPRLTAAQLRAYNALQDRPRVSGLSTGIEVGARELPTTSEEPAPVLTEANRAVQTEANRAVQTGTVEGGKYRRVETKQPINDFDVGVAGCEVCLPKGDSQLGDEQSRTTS
ncbi:hypothetical protein Q1695_005958 [Nippostrongylus brasiliensis]|nr:hypothetical protein Q1695_005958 [Nippostrongylus brasiliensis]